MRFFDIHQAQSYLNGSVVTLRKEASPPDLIFVQAIYNYRDVDNILRDREVEILNNGLPSWYMQYYVLPLPDRSGRIHDNWISLFSPALDFKPIPLGLSNYFDKKRGINLVASCYRIPARAWKIGLHRYNLQLHWVTFDEKDDMDLSQEADNLFRTDSLIRTIRDDYPSLQEALKLKETSAYKGSDVAFSRRFAITTNNFLVYKNMPNTPIGMIQDGEPNLNDRFFYLQQVLAEDIGE